MKPEWKEFVETNGPAKKPITRPAERFKELPGGEIRKEQERYGSEKFSGEAARDRRERNRLREKLMEKAGAAHKSSGHHTAELPEVDPQEIEQLLINRKERRQRKIEEKIAREKLKPSVKVESGASPKPDQPEAIQEFNREIRRLGKIIKRRR